MKRLNQDLQEAYRTKLIKTNQPEEEKNLTIDIEYEIPIIYGAEEQLREFLGRVSIGHLIYIEPLIIKNFDSGEDLEKQLQEVVGSYQQIESMTKNMVMLKVLKNFKRWYQKIRKELDEEIVIISCQKKYGYAFHYLQNLCSIISLVDLYQGLMVTNFCLDYICDNKNKIEEYFQENLETAIMFRQKVMTCWHKYE